MFTEEFTIEKNKEELSTKSYNIIIGLVLLWGFAANAVMCTLFQDFFAAWSSHMNAVIIGYLVIGFLGILINAMSENSFICFIAYNMVVLPLGVVLSITLGAYSHASIMKALIVTILITLFMIILSCVKPELFASMRKVLFTSLTAVVIIELVMLFTGIYVPKWWDWLVALLFCGYIGYDWYEAQQKERTVKNAIGSAFDLYLDIINLFLRILEKTDDN